MSAPTHEEPERMIDHTDTAELLAEARRLSAENLVESLKREREMWECVRRMRWLPWAIPVLMLVTVLTSVASLIVVLVVKFG
jgi:hypothetical protein